MTYAVKEIFYTLQGEGANTGRPRCSAASPAATCGRAARRIGPSAVCRFCDTDFVGTDGPGGGKFATPDGAGRARWPRRGPRGDPPARPLVVCTGGEPLLQLDAPLLEALHAARVRDRGRDQRDRRAAAGHRLALREPQGRRRRSCVRPGDELKLVYPQEGAEPERFERLDFRHFFLQPMDGPDARGQHRARRSRYCLAHPRWRLSLQTHKLLGIP